MSDLAQALFSPRSVAIVGASADPHKHSAGPLRFLLQHGYKGDIYPINRKSAHIGGLTAYPEVACIGKPIDHAFIMVPSAGVEAAVEDCANAGVRCATIMANGFAEAGEEGRARQNRLIAVARRTGMRIVGPNSLGLINAREGIALTASEVLSLPRLLPGSYSVVSQSGSLMGALLSRAHAGELGFSSLVSVGNEADLGLGDYIDMLVDDETTSTILLILETIRDAAPIARAARRAFAAGKPVIALHVGRSSVGRELAASHTGAIVGGGGSTSAFLRDCGIVEVENLSTLIDIPPLLLKSAISTGNRVAVASTSGGGGALVIDQLADVGADIVVPPEAFIDRMAEHGIPIGRSALIDVTLAGTNAESFTKVLTEAERLIPKDLMVVVVGASAQFRPERAVAPTAAFGAAHDQPIIGYITPDAPAAHKLLRDHGVASFASAVDCGDAVRAFFRRRPPVDRSDLPAEARACAAAVGQTIDRGGGTLALARALALPLAGEVLLTVDQVARGDLSAMTFDYPVVAKVQSPDIAHKTEVGGVMLSIPDGKALRAAASGMIDRVQRACPGALIEGIQVQQMARGLGEVLLGYVRDPQLGPLVSVGVGGVLAELYGDVASRMAPVDRATAREMIGEVKGLAVLSGYRNLPRGDLDALAALIERLSWLALPGAEPVVELEMNPVLVGETGVVAVDVLARIEARADLEDGRDAPLVLEEAELDTSRSEGAFRARSV